MMVIEEGFSGRLFGSKARGKGELKRSRADAFDSHSSSPARAAAHHLHVRYLDVQCCGPGQRSESGSIKESQKPLVEPIHYHKEQCIFFLAAQIVDSSLRDAEGLGPRPSQGGKESL